MRSIVTVFKTEFSNREFVKEKLTTLTKDTREFDDALVFSPKSGKLVEFLSVLKFYKIAYGTHFDTRDHEQLIREKF
jgi:hypothetical protein